MSSAGRADAEAGGDRLAIRALVAFTGSLIVVSAMHLRSGLDPGSLFLDDQWVGIAVRDAGFLERFVLHLPMPIGFSVLESLATRVVADPELALQIVPALAYLASVGLLAAVAWRLTGDPWAAALAGAMLASAPVASGLAVRAKHYTLDQLATVVALFVLVELARRRGPRLVGAVVVLLLGLLTLSFASIFLTGATVAAFLASTWLDEDAPREERARVTAAAGLFAAGAAALYLVDLRHVTRASMIDYWADYFPQARGWSALRSFVVARWWPFLAGALPPELAPFILVAPLGLLGLARRAGAWTAVTMLVFYLGTAAAAALRFYPLGTGRTDAFSFPVTVLLVALGVGEVVRRVPGPSVRRVTCASVVGLFVVYELATGGDVYAPGSYDRAVVAWLQERITPSDALVLSPFAAFAYGYYAAPGNSLRPDDDYGHGFDVRVARPATFQTKVGRPELRGPVDVQLELDRLAAFVADGGQRLFYLETHGLPRDRARIEETIVRGGYRLVERGGFSGPAEAFEFEAVSAATEPPR